MKIRAKITILFCATVILIMAVMGVISNRMNAVTTMDLVEKNLTVMADLAADDIAAQADPAAGARGILEKAVASANGYAFLADGDGQVAESTDTAVDAGFLEQPELVDAAEAISGGGSGFGRFTQGGAEMVYAYSAPEALDGQCVVIVSPQKDFSEGASGMLQKLLIVDVVVILAAIFVASKLAMRISGPVNAVKDALIRISQGDFSVEEIYARSSNKDELSVLEQTTDSLVHTLSDIMGEANAILGGITQYDLTMEDMKQYPGDFNKLSESVNAIKNILRGLILEVQEMSSGVATGSKELSAAAGALSDGTASQAASIQKMVADVEEVAQRIGHTSERGTLVNHKLKNLDTQIRNSNEQMMELLSVVKEIEEMSEDIRKIVKTIDGIAFQTNILALNASVEAARAGETGRGFAVVADEVGNLAARSGEESKKTAELVQKCIDAISNAKACADSTFESLNSIVQDSAEISQAFNAISEDSTEQAGKSGNIQKEIEKISDVVQMNTATAAETAASTETLSRQAGNLGRMIRQFKVNRDEDRISGS